MERYDIFYNIQFFLVLIFNLIINLQRSSDRSWRTVAAELRGTRLKLTVVREGKANQVSDQNF